jgi:hypothetical protein
MHTGVCVRDFGVCSGTFVIGIAQWHTRVDVTLPDSCSSGNLWLLPSSITASWPVWIPKELMRLSRLILSVSETESSELVEVSN